MLAKVLSGALLGIDAYPVDVEVDLALGLPQFATVGLPEGAVKESKDRVKSAIKNSGYEFPARRITINLAPADVKKDGAAFDLPMAIGLLAATGVVRPAAGPAYVLLGELSLDGRVKPVRGVLPLAVAESPKAEPLRPLAVELTPTAVVLFASAELPNPMALAKSPLAVAFVPKAMAPLPLAVLPAPIVMA